MAVSSVRLIGERRSGEKGFTLRTYTKVWRVETTDPLDGPAVAMTASGIGTQLVTTYASGNDSDTAARLVSISAEEDGDSRVSWIVTEQYSTSAPGSAEALQTNPMQDAVLYSLSFDQFESDLTVDNQGVAITTTAGEPFEGLRRDDSRPVLTVRRNESNINIPFVLFAKDAVNASSWKGCPPRTVKCKNITSGELQQRGLFSYYQVTYEFHLNPDTWDSKVLNRGHKFYADGVGETLTAPFPVLLDNSGFFLGDGEDPVFLTFRPYKELDFTIFGF